MAAFGLVPRPNFISMGGTQLLTIWAFNGNLGRNRGLDTWLVDRLGARGGYIGQHLSNDVCYGGRERQHWNADGTRVAKGEQIRPVMAADPQCQGLPTRRLVVYELVSRKPVPPEDRPPVVFTPDAPWAAEITDPKNRPGVGGIEPGAEPPKSPEDEDSEEWRLVSRSSPGRATVGRKARGSFVAITGDAA